MNIIIDRHKNIINKSLIIEPDLLYIKEFNEDAYKKFKDDFNKYINSGFDIIPVVIDSYGGSVDALLGMISIIRNSPVPVATILETKAMSCGVILFSCGTKGYRFMSPMASIMIHEVSNFSGGKIEEMKSAVDYGLYLNNKIFSIFDKNCGKNNGFFQKEIYKRKNADWYVDCDEAKNLGIADHTKIPNFNIKIKQKCSLDFI